MNVFYGRDIPGIFKVPEYRTDLQGMDPDSLYAVKDAKHYEGVTKVRFQKVVRLQGSEDKTARHLIKALRNDAEDSGTDRTVSFGPDALNLIADTMERLLKEAGR